MIIAALGSLALGLLCGLFVFPPEVIAVMDTVMSYALAVLIFFGRNRGRNEQDGIPKNS